MISLCFLLFLVLSISYSIYTVHGQTYTVTTIAGSGTNGYLEGIGTTASFRFLQGTVVGADGTIFVSDTSSHVIRKLDPRTGQTSLYAGVGGSPTFADGTASQARFVYPRQLAVDNSGNLYLADESNHRIRKISAFGIVSTLAGNGTSGYLDGPATASILKSPYGVAVDPVGDVYFSDTGNNRIRKITISTGQVSTLAGSGAAAFLDGQGTTASFFTPTGIALDLAGNVLVADRNNYRLRKVSSSGNVVSIPGISAAVTYVAVDGNSNLYVGYGCNIQKVAPDNTITPVVTSSNCIFSDGPGILFYSNFAQIAVDTVSSDLIVADMANCRVRRVAFCPTNFVFNVANKGCVPQVTANVITVSGNGTAAYLEGSGTVAQYSDPEGVAVAQDGTIYVSDMLNNRIRKIDPVTGVSSVFAGSGTQGFLDGQGTAASFYYPHHLALDSQGNVLVAAWGDQRVRKITPGGLVSTIAGSGNQTYADGIGTSASFNYPTGICVDSNDLVYVGDYGNYRVRKISPSRIVTTLAGSGNNVAIDGYATIAAFGSVDGLSSDKNGYLYVADRLGNRIRKVSPTGYVTTLVGNGNATSFDGFGLLATTNGPRGIFIDPMFTVYFTERNSAILRKLDPNGVTTTLTGSSGGYSDGVGTAALFASLGQIAYSSPTVDFVVADRSNQRIRRVVVCSSVSLFDSSSKSCICSTTETLSPTENCKCPQGFEFNVGKTACVLCAAGKFKSLLSQSSCTDCPTGSESAVNRQSCVNCASGKYRSSLNSGICIGCPLYATCNTTSLTSCQAGFKINTAGNACEQCPIGTQSSTGSLSCVSCTVGTTYRSSLAQSVCQNCPSNATCITISSFTCNAGYEPTGDGLGCSQCQEGYSKSSSGNLTCTQCGVGTESAANKQSCSSCGNGKYRPSTSFNKCISCPLNGICSASLLTKCIDGWKVNSNNDGCEQCPTGQDSDGSTCSPCQNGSFKPDQSYNTCIPCPGGADACVGSSVSCRTGFYYDSNVQCMRNETYFASLQTTATSSVVTMTVSVYSTVTFEAAQNIQTVTVSNNQGGIVNFQTVTVSQIVTISPTSGSSQQQAQSANSVTLDFIGTLPISPLIFGAAAFGAGLFIMLIFSLICWRKSPQRRKDDDIEGGMTSTGLNTTSQRTFTNNSTSVR